MDLAVQDPLGTQICVANNFHRTDFAEIWRACLLDRDRTENEQPRLVRTSLEKVRAQFSSVDLAVQDPRGTQICFANNFAEI